MAKSRRKGTSNTLTDIFIFLVRCVSVRKPKDEEDAKVKHHEKDDKMDISDFFHEELNVSCLKDGTFKHQQVYPEYLNPFANDMNENIIIDIQETSGYNAMVDYPDCLNPFDDDDDDGDDDDDDYPGHLNPFSGDGGTDDDDDK